FVFKQPFRTGCLGCGSLEGDFVGHLDLAALRSLAVVWTGAGSSTRGSGSFSAIGSGTFCSTTAGRFTMSYPSSTIRSKQAVISPAFRRPIAVLLLIAATSALRSSSVMLVIGLILRSSLLHFHIVRFGAGCDLEDARLHLLAVLLGLHRHFLLMHLALELEIHQL